FEPYLELLKAQHRIHPTFESALRAWASKLTYNELVRGPYLEKSQCYEVGVPLEQLELHEITKNTIRATLAGRSLYKHQTDALKILLQGDNAVIATGTSSGKTY